MIDPDMTFPRLTLLVAAFALSAPAVFAQQTATPPAEQTDDAPSEMAQIERAWARGDYVFVREGLKTLAERDGTALAQYRYGRVLLEGRGGPVDVPLAVSFLEKSVAQNHLEATTLLARVYLTGYTPSPARDPAKAAELLASAAARGNAEAQYYLGLLYRTGSGVQRDFKSAFNWFLAAAENDYLEAKYELSRAYSRGDGVAENVEQALHWLTEAASGGHAEAQFYLALALDNGQGTQQNRNEALNWFTRAAENGYPVAYRVLGRKYLEGDGVQPNPTEALRWLQKGAERRDTVAEYHLGRAFSGAFGIPADPQRSWNFYKLASDAGMAEATTAMARMLDEGMGVPVDRQNAVTLYRMALEQGDPAAALRLGQMAGAGLLDGLAPPHLAVPWAIAAAAQGDQAALDWVHAQADQGLRPARTAYGIWLAEHDQPADAIAYFRPAAEEGDTEAQFRLGMAYSTGAGLDQDVVQAHSWLNIAAAGGHSEAGKMRDAITDLMTPEQVAEAQAVARAFFATARGETSK
ncbi:hypothetical protein E7681_02820 [Thalassobius vesicularis]|uniref:Sel1 repeat family protein n=2 Tax=Thalassobius vesicularis TaxID=1294297 RepID=A0A4S3MD44_9RHOB|nr:hypothetical protein E7681_02820 [Thalassobius vesicularis]